MSSLMSLAFGFSWLVSLACEIAIIVVIATVVRRHRPDAHGGLLGWAIASLVWSIVHFIIRTVGPIIIARLGTVDTIIGFQSGMSVLGALVQVGMVVLFVRGLVQVAQPPRAPTGDPVGPYR